MERQRSLEACGLLDTPPEEPFDRLTRLAQQVFGTPMALVSLVDSHRVWFKSRQGLERPEVPREIAFCSHAILGDGPLVVPDTAADPRFVGNPLVVLPPHIRFYAGAPVRTPEGFRIGALCLMDYQPRTLTSRELEILTDLAGCVEREVGEAWTRACQAVEKVRAEEDLDREQRLNQAIERAPTRFISEADRRRAFEGLLSDLLGLTRSAYGFMGEVRLDPAGKPYLTTYALTDISWDERTRELYELHRRQGLEFRNLETLFGAVMTSGAPVLSNEPSQDPRRGGLPEGHPPLRAFLGLPVHCGEELVAVIGLANRPGGYDSGLVEFLKPLLITVGLLVEAGRIQRQISEGERRFGTILEGAQVGTWEWNLETGATQFNERWAEILGYRLAELEPFDREACLALIHPEDAPAVRARIDRYLSGEVDYFDSQCRMRHKDGSWVWVQDRGRFVRWDEDGRPLLMCGTHADITREKEAERALREQASHTRAIINTMADGLVTVDHQGTITFFSPAAERIFGYSAREVLGRNVSLLMPSPHREAHDGYLRRYLETGQARVVGSSRETEARRKDGSYFPIELAVSEASLAGLPVFVGVIRDLTERKRIERVKGEFISMVSHELRTPLTAISGALGLVSGGVLGQLPAPIQRMVGIAHKNSQRLAFLIDDLLDMEKLVAGKMRFDFQVQPLMPLVEQALEDNRGYRSERRVALRLSAMGGSPTVRVDGQRLLQVLANFLSNAVKFSPEDGTVEVDVQERDAAVRVTVSDSGPGIPEEFRQRIFQKFAQADSSEARQVGGTGLGLAISRELIERMGGRIGFESVEGQGACFFFDLPLWQGGEAPASQGS